MQIQRTSEKQKILILILVMIMAVIRVGGAAFAQDGQFIYLPLVFKDAGARPPEEIMILSPASGSRVTSPVTVSGVASPTFEQNLVVRVLTADGNLVTLAPTTIQADIGQRGPFELELPLNLASEQNIFIQVFSDSPRDGGITHLSSAGVIFTSTGPEDIRTREPYPEQISIFEPQPGATLIGGTVHVTGFGLAGFEQSLLVELLDENGNVLVTEPVMVQAPELGEPGPFEVSLELEVTEAQNGRVVVRDISPAFGGDVHRSSVEVHLVP